MLHQVARVLGALAGIALMALAAYILASRPPAPAVEFTTLDGERLSMRDLRGKVVLVNFCATSCATCIKEMPDVIRTYERFAPRGFELIAVAMSYDPPESVRNDTTQHRLPFKVVLDTQGRTAAALDNVNLTPTGVLIDKTGRDLRRIVGEPNFAALHALINQELTQ
ncbi:TlpA family protein disulfide reductase [Cupriavidus basilensis]